VMLVISSSDSLVIIAFPFFAPQLFSRDKKCDSKCMKVQVNMYSVPLFRIMQISSYSGLTKLLNMLDLLCSLARKKSKQDFVIYEAKLIIFCVLNVSLSINYFKMWIFLLPGYVSVL
jgi:hypothetical protein